MFHVHDDLSISLLLGASNMKTFFANVRKTALKQIETNTKGPQKSCVNSLPARNEFKVTLFLLYLKKSRWKALGILLASLNQKFVYNHELHVYINM